MKKVKNLRFDSHRTAVPQEGMARDVEYAIGKEEPHT